MLVYRCVVAHFSGYAGANTASDLRDAPMGLLI